MTEDYLAGWLAARAQYQSTGGVQPFPPGYAPEMEVAKEAKTPSPAKKATRKPKEA